MPDPASEWNAKTVRTWLESRVQSSRLDQAAADRQGHEARDDYDKAAAEEWVCRTLAPDGSVDDQATLARRIKELITLDSYSATGVNDHERFERHVRTALRKVARMTKANEGFSNTRRYR